MAAPLADSKAPSAVRLSSGSKPAEGRRFLVSPTRRRTFESQNARVRSSHQENLSGGVRRRIPVELSALRARTGFVLGQTLFKVVEAVADHLVQGQKCNQVRNHHQTVEEVRQGPDEIDLERGT